MVFRQFQNQDPMKPASNQELMQKMMQISSMQCLSMLQAMLKELASQNEIGAAENLVDGLDENNEDVVGTVASVRLDERQVYLGLDSYKRLKLSIMTIVAPGANAAAVCWAGTRIAPVRPPWGPPAMTMRRTRMRARKMRIEARLLQDARNRNGFVLKV